MSQRRGNLDSKSIVRVTGGVTQHFCFRTFIAMEVQ